MNKLTSNSQRIVQSAIDSTTYPIEILEGIDKLGKGVLACGAIPDLPDAFYEFNGTVKVVADAFGSVKILFRLRDWVVIDPYGRSFLSTHEWIDITKLFLHTVSDGITAFKYYSPLLLPGYVVDIKTACLLGRFSISSYQGYHKLCKVNNKISLAKEKKALWEERDHEELISKKFQETLNGNEHHVLKNRFLFESKKERLLMKYLHEKVQYEKEKKGLELNLMHVLDEDSPYSLSEKRDAVANLEAKVALLEQKIIRRELYIRALALGKSVEQLKMLKVKKWENRLDQLNGEYANAWNSQLFNISMVSVLTLSQTVAFYSLTTNVVASTALISLGIFTQGAGVNKTFFKVPNKSYEIF